MKVSKLFLLAFGMAACVLSHAQQPADTPVLPNGEASPPPADPASPEKPKGRPGFVRLWYFAEPNQPPIGAFALENRQATEVDLDRWICRNLPPGFLASFNALPAGKYFLQVQPDEENSVSVSPEGQAKAHVAADKSKIKTPFEFTVAPSSYQTICLVSENGNLTAKLFAESGAAGQGKLRVFNFVGDRPAEIFGMTSGTPKKIGEAAANSVTELPVSPSGGAATYQVKVQESNGKIRSYALEIDPGNSQIASIAIFRDRYGRMTAQPADGAPKSAQ